MDMVFDKVLRNINEFEEEQYNYFVNSEIFINFRKVIKTYGLMLSCVMNRTGNPKDGNYSSQICISVIDKNNNDLDYISEPLTSFETFHTCILQTKKNIEFLNFEEDNEFISSFDDMKRELSNFFNDL